MAFLSHNPTTGEVAFTPDVLLGPVFEGVVAACVVGLTLVMISTGARLIMATLRSAAAEFRRDTMEPEVIAFGATTFEEADRLQQLHLDAVYFGDGPQDAKERDLSRTDDENEALFASTFDTDEEFQQYKREAAARLDALERAEREDSRPSYDSLTEDEKSFSKRFDDPESFYTALEGYRAARDAEPPLIEPEAEAAPEAEPDPEDFYVFHERGRY